MWDRMRGREAELLERKLFFAAVSEGITQYLRFVRCVKEMVIKGASF
jgi:hypothetical protein